MGGAGADIKTLNCKLPLKALAKAPQHVNLKNKILQKKNI